MYELPCTKFHFSNSREENLRILGGIYLSTGIEPKKLSEYSILLAHTTGLYEKKGFSEEEIQNISKECKPYCKTQESLRQDDFQLILSKPCVLCKFSKSYMNARKEKESQLLYAIMDSIILPHDIPGNDISNIFSSYELFPVATDNSRYIIIRFHCMMQSIFIYFSSMGISSEPETITSWLLSLYENTLCENCQTEDEKNIIRLNLRERVNTFIKNKTSLDEKNAGKILRELRTPYNEFLKKYILSGALPQKNPKKPSTRRTNRAKLVTIADQDVKTAICNELGERTFENLKSYISIPSLSLEKQEQNHIEEHTRNKDASLEKDIIPSDKPDNLTPVEIQKNSSNDKKMKGPEDKNTFEHKENIMQKNEKMSNESTDHTLINQKNDGFHDYLKILPVLLSKDLAEKSICINPFTIANFEISCAKNRTVSIEIMSVNDSICALFYFNNTNKFYYKVGMNIYGCMTMLFKSKIKIITTNSCFLQRYINLCNIKFAKLPADLFIYHTFINEKNKDNSSKYLSLDHMTDIFSRMKHYELDCCHLEELLQDKELYKSALSQTLYSCALSYAFLDGNGIADKFKPIFSYDGLHSYCFGKKKQSEKHTFDIHIDSPDLKEGYIYSQIICSLFKLNVLHKYHLSVICIDKNHLTMKVDPLYCHKSLKDILWNIIQGECKVIGLDAPNISISGMEFTN